MAGGAGTDTYAGGDATSRVFAQRGEKVASPGRVTYVPLGSRDASGHAPGYLVHVSGSAMFRQRVTSDITSLLSVPAGRALLTALDDAGHAVSVTQSSAGNQTTVPDPKRAFLKTGGAHGAGSAAAISYNPYETTSTAARWLGRPGRRSSASIMSSCTRSTAPPARCSPAGTPPESPSSSSRRSVCRSKASPSAGTLQPRQAPRIRGCSRRTAVAPSSASSAGRLTDAGGRARQGAGDDESLGLGEGDAEGDG